MKREKELELIYEGMLDKVFSKMFGKLEPFPFTKDEVNQMLKAVGVRIALRLNKTRNIASFSWAWPYPPNDEQWTVTKISPEDFIIQDKSNPTSRALRLKWPSLLECLTEFYMNAGKKGPKHVRGTTFGTATEFLRKGIDADPLP